MLTSLENTDIFLPIPGTITIAGQEVKRTICIVSLQYNIENKNITIEGVISFTDLEDNPIQTKLIRPYSVRMLADNTHYCDMEGVTLCDVANAELEENALTLSTTPHMREYEWFYLLANTQPIIVNDLIRQFFLRGLLQNRFD